MLVFHLELKNIKKSITYIPEQKADEYTTPVTPAFLN